MVEIIKDVFVEIEWLDRHNAACYWDHEAWSQTGGWVETLEMREEEERLLALDAYYWYDE